MNMSDHHTISERVPVGYDPLYIETHHKKAFKAQQESSFYPLIKVHLAWIVMLAEQDIVPDESATQLCRTLLELQTKTPDVLLPFVPEWSDVYVHMEKYLVRQLGEEHVGHLALARTRPEPIARMRLRERLLKVIDASLALRQNLLDTAERNVDAVMPGYTHSQPAQPTTFGHYLMAVYDPVAEDTQYMEDAYDNVNRCTLGCGALAGTAFPIDRHRVADLLGFDGVYENTFACVGSNDLFVASANAVVDTMVTLSRMSQDLNEWCAYEVRMMLTAPQFSDVSSMMPQKYNPSVLELTRFHTAHSLTLAQNVANILMKSHYGDVREVDQVWYPTFEALDNAADTMRLFGAGINTMIIYKDRMLDLARTGFATVSELADEIYRRTGLPYRTSHGIVVDVVNQALDQGGQAMDITSEMLDRAAEKVIGQPLNMSQEDIFHCLDPVAFVESHDVLGGPAPRQVLRAIERSRERLAEARQRQTERRARLETGERLLNEAVQKIIATTA
jgi:argininosuccinate lyase